MIKNKKLNLSILLILILCAIFSCTAFLSFMNRSKAESNLDYSSSTFYPKFTKDDELSEVQHYINLSNITYFGITDNLFCYTLDNNSIYVYDLINKTIKFNISHNDINNINYINCTDNYLFVSSNNQLFVFNLNTFDSLNPTYTTLSQIVEYKLIDIYFTDETILIGIISQDNKFKVLEFDNDLNFIYQYSPNEEIPSNYPSQLSINNHDAYMIYGTTENNQNMICKLTNYRNIDLLIKSVAYKITDTINISQVEYNNDNYLALTNISGVCLLNTDILFDDDISNDYPTEYVYTVLENQPAPPNNAITTGYISKAYDIKTKDNLLYVSDYTGKFIQTFTLTTKITNEIEKTTIVANEIILGSTGGDVGRFNGKVDYTITDSNNIYVADTLNNRIQIIDNQNNTIKEIKAFSGFIQPNTQVKPRDIIKDSYRNLYFIGNYDNSNNFNLIFKFNNSENSLATIIPNDFGAISDITIDTLDTLYFINSTTNKLYKQQNTDLKEIEVDQEIKAMLDSNAKIKFLNNKNLLMIYNINTIALLTTSGEKVIIKDNFNISDLTLDFENNIYILNGNSIKVYSIKDTDIVIENTHTSNNLSYYANIEINKENGDILAFNTNRSALEIIKNISSTNFENPFNIAKDCYLEEINNPIKINDNSLIYKLPGIIGNSISPTSKVVYPIASITIGNVNYTQVIYNLDNNINFGYIREKDILKTYTFETNKQTIIAINKEVSIYTLPTINNFELEKKETLKLGKITRKSTLTALGTLPISFDTALGSTELVEFYVVSYDNKIGFVNTADFTLKNESVINKLKDKNATIKILDDNKYITVYDEDLNEIGVLHNNDKIVVENFNAKEEYTSIYYYDEDLNEIHGLIKTKYIKLDKVNNTVKLVLYISLAAVVLGVILVIVYIKIKKNSDKNI